jgi:hypothetical protein
MREDQLKIVIIPTARFNADPISYIRPQRNKFERSPGQSIDVVLRGSVFDAMFCLST